MPAREEEIEKKQDREEGQMEKDSGGNTAVEWKGGLEERRKQGGKRRSGR